MISTQSSSLPDKKRGTLDGQRLPSNGWIEKLFAGRRRSESLLRLASASVSPWPPSRVGSFERRRVPRRCSCAPLGSAILHSDWALVSRGRRATQTSSVGGHQPVCSAIPLTPSLDCAAGLSWDRGALRSPRSPHSPSWPQVFSGSPAITRNPCDPEDERRG
jgi:hypothetical protein